MEQGERFTMPSGIDRKSTLTMPRSGALPSRVPKPREKKMRRPAEDKMLRGPVEDKMLRGSEEDKTDERAELDENKFLNRAAYRAAVNGKVTAAFLDRYEPREGGRFTTEEVRSIIQEMRKEGK
jgi:hypothetical protein